MIPPSPVAEDYKFFSNRILLSSRTFMLCRLVLMIYFVALFFISSCDENVCFSLHSWTKILKQSMRRHCDGFSIGYSKSRMKPRIYHLNRRYTFLLPPKEKSSLKNPKHVLVSTINIDQFDLSVNNKIINLKPSKIHCFV